MLPGPIFRREVKAGARLRDLFRMRTLLGTLLGAITIGPALVIVYAQEIKHTPPDWIGLYWLAMFAVVAGVELAFTVLWTTGVVSPSLSQEREKDTLPLLLLTRLNALRAGCDQARRKVDAAVLAHVNGPAAGLLLRLGARDYPRSS